ncbi:hypothetical protein [Allorhizobium taibaishanense]|uniref:Growth inhibitor PemK n=1 Tax=Allorhizobium taibaishanense TaxID=887144 RepID=A0A1Q8ZZU7_9HYPH|nr:hypothetical protein [Allorhizobium taibaishanense]MBB4007189.1 hypothetical protein [Allorhizobium taibaishanense]OLP47796.1 hypothetical protein BJF91_05400 [Allorhizobium taibaishanense]
MNYPDPVPGLVIRYNYLWRKDELEGFALGEKDRPCAIILASRKTGLVTVIPITHSPPEPGEEHLSIEIPLDICRQCGLDSGGNYIRLGETNRFLWPGIHLRPLLSDPSRIDYGVLPKPFFESVMARVIEMVEKQMVSLTKRS